MNLILFEETELGRSLSPDDRRAVHLLRVLRAKPGDRFRGGVVNGPSGYIEVTDVSTVGIGYHHRFDEEPVPLLPLTLVVGTPRPLVTRRLLKDLASLGAASLVFVYTELGERSYLDSSLWRDSGYRAALLEGAEQGGSTLLPEVGTAPSITRLLSERGDSWPAFRLVLDPEAPMRLGAAVMAGSPAVLAVGPERGLTPRELKKLDAAGFSRASIGKRILRTEAAALAGAALLLSGMELI